MEKDDEVAGDGNTNTAEFWEYDARLGRRWNLDPVVKVWESSYLCFSGNPIWFNDIDGDNASKPDYYFDRDGNYLGKDKAETKEIRFTTKAVFDASQSIADPIKQTEFLQKYSTTAENVVLNEKNLERDLKAAAKVANKMYELSGYSLDELVGGSVSTYKGNDIASIEHNSINKEIPKGKFKINVNLEATYQGPLLNFYDYKNMYKHERGGHGSDYIKGLKYSGSVYWNWERRATRLMVKDDSWVKTSLDFKICIWKAYGKNKFVFNEYEQWYYFGKYGANVTYPE